MRVGPPVVPLWIGVGPPTIYCGVAFSQHATLCVGLCRIFTWHTIYGICVYCIHLWRV